MVSCHSLNSNHIEDKDSVEALGRKSSITNKAQAVDSFNSLLDWKETNFGLWRSKNGDLAIKTREGNDEGIFIDRYITELCCEGGPIKDIIDTATFKYLGSSFYKDKNNVYTHYTMLDGGNFWIVENADVPTFEVIGNSCYAKDKNYIYGERAMQMPDIDYKTFKTCDDCGCYAKDRNGYYFWDTKIDTVQMLANEKGLSVFKLLKKL